MSRLITAAVALPVIIASILVPALWPLFTALAAAAMAAGLYEFWWLARKRGMNPDVVIGFAAAASLLIAFYFDEPVLVVLIVPAFTIIALVAATLRGAPFEKMLSSVGATLLGVFYVVLLGGHLIAVRTGAAPGSEHRATHLLCFFFLIIMGSDAGAYYTGRAFGKHKLAPGISPGKTWEGAAGGMAASLALAAAAHFWFFPELSLRVALPLAAVLNILGVLGDLTESALKRGAGAKDAANILPGHGGLLDRLDSLLFNAPVIYYFGRYYFR